MAPFGRNFLKARLKRRTKEAEPVVGKEIQVSVCDEEKVVCGVTKHTTCADMVRALLEDHKSIPENQRTLHGDPSDFCLLERWRGCERALPPLTRILRLWYAWGDHRSSIQFVLVKTSDLVAPTPKKCIKAKGARPKRREDGRGQHLLADKQKRMVRKAFRKLEKLHKESECAPGGEEIDRMVQLILQQDATIREQLRHMRAVDVRIQGCELQLLGDVDVDCASSPTLRMEQEEWFHCSDGVEQLETQIRRHQELIFQLSRDIDGELLKWEEESGKHDGSAKADAAAATSLISDSDSLHVELQNLHDELNRSIFTGVSLQARAAEMEEQLKYFDELLVHKDEECWRLASQLNALLIADAAEQSRDVAECPESDAQHAVAHTEKTRHPASPADVDTDSDTGISSTHSQDSLSPCLEFPPPLDTDV